MSVIKAIQDQVVDKLSSDPFFQNIPVFAEYIGDIVNQMEIALGADMAQGGKVGAFVLVMSPDANQSFGELYGVVLDDIKIFVQVTVDTKMANDPVCGIGVTDLDICEAVCLSLSQFMPLSANSMLKPQTPTIQIMDRGENGSTRMCRFSVVGKNSTVPVKSATPVISETGGVVTLTCATAGAAIFYTTDGKNPIPRGPTTILYTGPFTPGAGLTLTARSFLAGYLHSQQATVITT